MKKPLLRQLEPPVIRSLKATVALRSLDPYESFERLAKDFGVTEQQVGRWQDQLVRRAPDIFHTSRAARRRYQSCGGPRGIVYFMQEGHDGPVKIGRASHPDALRAKLQPGHLKPLRVIATFPGDAARERIIHRDLKPFRLEGKWYSPARKLFQYIETLRNPICEFDKKHHHAWAVLERETEEDPTDPCPFCGRQHRHGISDSHRVAHCNPNHPGVLQQITRKDGTVLRMADGYILRTRRT